MLRTHNCGELRLKYVNRVVTLCGWVQEIRDKGHLLWIDLRDRYGITQILLEKNTTPDSIFAKMRTIGREYVLQVQGKVVERSAKNKERSTGDIEISPSKINILNGSQTPPFSIADEPDSKEALRMRYRYMDLRRSPLIQNLTLRHQVTKSIHAYLSNHGFLEIETPILVKSTPEGARDFIVPARMHPGQYYALPQSPQLFKQLTMVAGLDRYYQIAKCFRDEDLRADRQPEFTQIDCEMSFVDVEDLLCTFEGLVRHIFQSVLGITLLTFPRMTYAEAMEKYGSDKPDLRWGMPFVDLTQILQGSAFQPFARAPIVLAISVPRASTTSRKQLNQFRGFIEKNHPKISAFAYVKYSECQTYSSSLDKFYNEEELKKWIVAATNATPNDLLILLSGPVEATRIALADLKKEIIHQLVIPPTTTYAPLWVVDFPLFFWNESEQTYESVHHPFTAPIPEEVPLLETSPTNVRSQAYDMVINGVEVGGGSLRIHQRVLQEKIFEILGLKKKDIEAQFGFLLHAFEYGAPPHGGIALGLDRLCVILGGGSSIREYIAFPKNNQGKDVMINAPAAWKSID